jgi:hypothetical protein
LCLFGLMLPSVSIRVAGVWRHVTCGVTQNIANGGERVGLEKEFNIRKLAGSERGCIYCSLFMDVYD